MSFRLAASRRYACLLFAVALAVAAVASAVASAKSEESNDARGPAVLAGMAKKVQAVDPTCTSGAHTLSKAGDHVYPELGNGGYTSLHTNVNLIYDATTNAFLAGNNVELQDEARECLSDFSLDFAAHTAEGQEGGEEAGEFENYPGANMQVDKVLVNGVEAQFTMAEPTYPGDPAGQNDVKAEAHLAGLGEHVSGPASPPPACAPSATEHPQDESRQGTEIGEQCPNNKLVITPATPIQSGEQFVVKVEYSGHPGVYVDGDESLEGWFRSNDPVGDGAFVTTEPAGSAAWMPLNDHPSAKPTYDFNETVTKGRTVIANGELIDHRDNPPSAAFPNGSTTWEWHSPEPIANYLVENSIGNFSLSQTQGQNGITYFEAQAEAISAADKAANKAVIDQQRSITEFQETLNGPFPFTTNGVVVGQPPASFEEEMQGKITFNGGNVGNAPPALPESTLAHENMHQWWGDNVSESNFNETFFKEGMARFSQYAEDARRAGEAAGALDSAAGKKAFDESLVKRFNKNYSFESTAPAPTRTEKSDEDRIWSLAPSDPTEATLFKRSTTYNRSGTAYIALRAILGDNNFAAALHDIQQNFRGGSIEETQLVAAFQRWLPVQTPSCHARLNRFFAEWFDTKFQFTSSDPTTLKPQLTGPGLAPSASGTTFYNADGSCTAEAPVTAATVSPGIKNGQVVGPATVALTAKANGNGKISTEYKVDAGAFQIYNGPFEVKATGKHTVEYHSFSGDGGAEGVKSVSFTVVAAPTPAKVQACPSPKLTIAVSHPLRKKKGVFTVRRGKAYHYVGKLTCGTAGTPAPEGTAILVGTLVGRDAVHRLTGTTVGAGGKIDTLLQLAGKRTVVFSYGADGVSTEARIKVAVARR